jgi:hypothetical protein
MPKPKKQKYAAKFNKEWSTELPFIQSSEQGKHHAYCSWCKCHISIAGGGGNDISKHCSAEKYKKIERSLAKSLRKNEIFIIKYFM